MQQFFRAFAALTALSVVAFLGACTVHHHHGEDGQPMAGQPTSAYPAYQGAPQQGAPGSYARPYARPDARAHAPAPGTPINPGYGPYDNSYDSYDSYDTYDENSDDSSTDEQPTDPYAAVPGASAHGHACTCPHSSHRRDRRVRKRAPAFAPKTYAPAGPVRPSDMRSNNPADWLE